MKKILYILVLSFLYSCSGTKVVVTELNDCKTKSDSLETTIDSLQAKIKYLEYISDKTTIKNECGEIISNKLFIGSSFHELYTFNNNTNVYCLPDTTSTIIDTLPFFTHIKSWESINNNGVAFFNRKHYISRNPNIKGYIYNKDVVLGKYCIAEKYLIVEFSNPNTVQIRKRGEAKDEFNTLESTYNFKTYQEWWQMNDCNTPVLKNVDQLFNYQNNYEACPGTQNNEYVAHTKNGNFIDLYTTTSMGESGYYYSSDIYFPIKFGDGSIKLTLSSTSDDIFNFNKGKLNIYPFPKWLGIPIEKLVVVVEKNIDAIDLENSYGIKKVSVKKTTKYFKWTGSKLVLVKTINKNWIEKDNDKAWE